MIRALLLFAFVVGTVHAEVPSDFAYGVPLVLSGSGPFA
jgi:hypothetical protein